MKHPVALLCFILIPLILHSQDLTQDVTGFVVDKALQQPLPGAHVIVLNTYPPIGVATDGQGYFRIPALPVGRVSLAVSFVGYQQVVLPKLLLTSGKELQVFVELEQSIALKEVTVRGSQQKTRPTNEMALVSARAFTVEETERYAGTRGDVARMAANYAGVLVGSDWRNDIVIRGNSPSGLLWRLDGVEIPNPNHFAESGTTGGPVSMLNNNVLRNSDFYTGAFPAEFGNALSGVFDLRMRPGNISRHEFTLQSGFAGLEAGVEGPLRRGNSSSYLANYRYSFPSLMDRLGFDFHFGAIPRYQDFVSKLSYPTRSGLLRAYILAGMSSIDILSNRTPEADELTTGIDIYNRARLGVAAISYLHHLSSRSHLKTVLSALYQGGGSDIDQLDANDQNPLRIIEHGIDEFRASLLTHLTHRHSPSFTSQVGLQASQLGYRLTGNYYSWDSLRLLPYMDQSKSLLDGPQLLRAYYQMKWRVSPALDISSGINSLYFTLNGDFSLEPRVALSLRYAPNTSLTAGYGLHARAHPLQVYFFRLNRPGNGYTLPNRDLGFTRAHHLVVGNHWSINPHFRLKAEAYYQRQFDVPVSPSTGWFSILNTGAYWGVDVRDSLVNRGLGRNHGVELTIERFLHRGYYFLVTASLFSSRYMGSDGVWRHTTFNGSYVINALAGYELPISRGWSIAFDGRATTAGGRRYIPIDLERSIAAGEARWDERYIFERQHKPYFRLDLEISLIRNRPRSTQQWQVSVENVTNHRNVQDKMYIDRHEQVFTVYQMGLFPMVMWRLTF